MYIIFSDVDNTMIDHNLHLLDQTLNDIAAARNKGITFVICTGNSHLENMAKLAQRVNADYLVTSDGARLYDCKRKEIIYKKMILANKANAILQKIKPLTNHITWTTESELYISARDSRSRELAVRTNKKYNCKSGNFRFAETVAADIYKFSCFGQKKSLDLITDLLSKDNVSYLRHNDHFLTISAPGCNKGKAVLALTAKQNSDPTKIMVIGDGKNDISMLKVSANSYAVANAVSSLKEVAQRHTSSVDQNGLGEAITDFMFRNKI